MNLYLIYQDKNNGYDTCDSAVVVAESEEKAKRIHPSGHYIATVDDLWEYSGFNAIPAKTTSSWCAISDVKVKFIGTTETENEGTVICSSFNAS